MTFFNNRYYGAKTDQNNIFGFYNPSIFTEDEGSYQRFLTGTKLERNNATSLFNQQSFERSKSSSKCSNNECNKEIKPRPLRDESSLLTEDLSILFKLNEMSVNNSILLPVIDITKQRRIPPSMLVMEYFVNMEDIIIIENSNNIYSPLYSKAPFELYGIKYNSVDEVYHCKLFSEVYGCKEAEKHIIGKDPAFYKTFVNQCLISIGKTSKDIVNWRIRSGINIIVEATALKFKKNKELLNKLVEERHKVIFNAVGEDSYDACGPIDKLYKWIDEKYKESIMIPMEDPIVLEFFPTISEGKNVQGLLVMLARELILDSL